MASINKKKIGPKTHEGANASHLTPEQELRRSVMACLLWEDAFYENGEDIGTRIANLVKYSDPEQVKQMAIEARQAMHLRHVPLLLCTELARHKQIDKTTLNFCIQRPDELTEFLALYWRYGKCPLSAQVKRGLAEAFTKFSTYQLAKYNRSKAIKLRDVMFMVHPKPKTQEQADTFKKLADGTLEAPDTWEVNLSAGKNKKAMWERLIKENKLGGMALLRNLRNMQELSVPTDYIKQALNDMNVHHILPFRFIAAARFAPRLEPEIEKAMLKSIESLPKLDGKTIILVDVSGSMIMSLSRMSDMNRLDAACGIAVCAREVSSNVSLHSFSNYVRTIPSRHGFALRDAIKTSQEHRGTHLGDAIRKVNAKEQYDRLIIITDEQSHDDIPAPKGKAYIINVGSYQCGVGYGKYIHIHGFSEAVLNYIAAYEAL